MKRLIILIFGVFSLAVVVAQKASSGKPNIIWLMAEDMSLDLACYGMQAVKTPNLDRMAAQGVRFDHCYVTNPICSPSRSSMMVGVHQQKINAQHHRSNRDVPLHETFKPFTYWLRQAGYTCVLGHHGVMNKGRKIDVNFKHDAIGQWDGKSQFGLFDKYDTFSKADQPFFAQIQLNVTHRGDWWDEVRKSSAHPVHPDSVVLPPYLADHPAIRLDWAKYLDQVEYMDKEVGMIFQELEAKGLADNTIVIFIGDNGRCNLKGKGYLYDPGLRIPFIVYYPKALKGGQVRKDVASSMDITATILDFAQVKLPDYMDGKPVFDNKFQREFVFATRDLWDEILEESKSITSPKLKYIRNYKPKIPYDAHQAYLEFYRPALHIMRNLDTLGKLTKDQKLYFAASKPKEELYDLSKDPFELNNLANNTRYSGVLKQLREKTDTYNKNQLPVNNIYQPEDPDSVQVLEWVKKAKPELYIKMLAGEEIGFQRLSKEYKQKFNRQANTKE